MAKDIKMSKMEIFHLLDQVDEKYGLMDSAGWKNTALIEICTKICQKDLQNGGR